MHGNSSLYKGLLWRDEIGPEYTNITGRSHTQWKKEYMHFAGERLRFDKAQGHLSNTKMPKAYFRVFTET